MNTTYSPTLADSMVACFSSSSSVDTEPSNKSTNHQSERGAAVGVDELSNIAMQPHLEGRTAVRKNGLSTRTVYLHISHCCLHFPPLSSYLSINCSNFTHYVMILKRSYKIRPYSNIFGRQPPASSSRKVTNC